MKVILLNPEDVRSTLYEVGKFASVCKNDELPTVKDCIRIGKSCFNSGHNRPIYTVNWKFYVEGISRVCSHQLVRHKVGVNVNQASGVFQPSVSDNTDFVIPTSVLKCLDEDEELKKQYFSVLNASLVLSEKLLEQGVSNSDARYIIPQSQITGMNMTFTPTAFFHFCHERLCSRAQWEIRSVCKAMLDEVIKCEPFFAKFCVPKCMYLKGCNEYKSCGLYEALTKKEEKPNE